MKFRNIIRMQMVLAGLGVAMLFTGSAYAQQEMDPAPFDDSPYVQPMPQPAPGTSAATTSPAETNSANIQLANVGTDSAVQVESTVTWTPIDQLTVMALLVCAACVLLYEIAKAKSENNNARAKRSPYMPRSTSTL